jgi:peptide subunit release factor 1 (eRF1)
MTTRYGDRAAPRYPRIDVKVRTFGRGHRRDEYGTGLAASAGLERGAYMTLTEQIDRLAAFEPGPFPVVSLYLNTQPGQHGRDQWHTFIRKEFRARARTYPQHSPERESVDRDLERIAGYLDTEVQPSTNGVAVFACSSAELFEVIQTNAPIDRHWLSISDRPHLYPLARLDAKWPKYAAVLAATNASRVLVMAGGELVSQRNIDGVKTRRGDEGGMAQMRFQRHIENFHLHHVKDLVLALEQIVQQEGISQILIAGDEVVTPLLREQMPKHLAEKIVDHMRVEPHAPLAEIVRLSLDAMNKVNERTDREKVETAIGAYRAGGLGVVGPDDVLGALAKGQVDELLLSASLQQVRHLPGSPVARNAAHGTNVRMESEGAAAVAGEAAEAGAESVRIADALVTKARQTAAKITFIEDSSLLADWGGAAALLRFRI